MTSKPPPDFVKQVPVITTTADNAHSVYAADVNNDGHMDVLSASYNDDTIAWYESEGNESFTKHVITASADGAESVYAADVNGDGYMDVLSWSSFSVCRGCKQ